MKPLKFLLPAIILVAAIAAGVKKHDAPLDPNELSATVYAQPQTLPSFNLLDDNQKPFTEKNLKDHWSLIFFGFSHCPGLCPTTLSQLNTIYQQLPENKLPHVVFITIDPERDNPQRLHDYLPQFNSDFIGVTGNEKDLDKLKNFMGVLVMAPSGKDVEGHYDIDHSGAIMLINPKGQLHALFTTPHNTDVIAREIMLLEEHARS